ncbi:MAG: heme A synthase [Candidatus Competibacterales bacterium]
MDRSYFALILTALGLTFVIIVFGAFVRLSDAGLGCPDWPGCYGHLVIPAGEQWIPAANESFPERPVELAKAWIEMIHRHLAKFLGLLIIALAFVAWRRRRVSGRSPWLSVGLVGLVVFQGILGAWTVTLQLKPLVVTAHLLGGMAIFALLGLLALRQLPWPTLADGGARRLRPFVWLGLGLVVGQIFLGGWTSTNYAALACPDFPTCHTRWWPPAMDFQQGFVLWRGLGVNYEYGVLSPEARVAVHMAHRLGALVVVAYWGALLLALGLGVRAAVVRWLGLAVGVALALQVALGIANIVWLLPLGVAVAHNGAAALLLLATTALVAAVQRAAVDTRADRRPRAYAVPPGVPASP